MPADKAGVQLAHAGLCALTLVLIAVAIRFVRRSSITHSKTQCMDARSD
jgi:hypothetical protein